MAMITLACKYAVINFGWEGIQITKFDTYIFRYRSGVVDESNPITVPMDSNWVLKIAAMAVESASRREQLGLLGYTLSWERDGRKVANWTLYYPALPPVGSE